MICKVLMVIGLLPVLAVGQVRVVATTTMVADLVRSIGGERVQVTGLMGAGVDPHLYKPARKDIVAIQKAAVVFYNGLHLEGKMTEVLEKLERRGARVIALAETLPEDALLYPETEGPADPHVWFDVSLWRQCVDAVVQGLSAADPDGRAEYAAAGERVARELARLHQWVTSEVEKLRKEQRVLVTSHDAYGYFGRAYGFEVIGVQGISTVAEAGLADVTQAVDLVKGRGVRAIFVESSVSPRTLQRIAQDAGVSIGGELFSDAMGGAGEMRELGGQRFDVGSYDGMIRYNVRTIVSALQGEEGIGE